jgi:hypothetical protein
LVIERRWALTARNALPVCSRLLWLSLFGVTLTAARADVPLLASLAGSGTEPPPPWHVAGLPKQAKPFTRFSVVDVDGRRAFRGEADSSYGNLVHAVTALARRSACHGRELARQVG